MSMPFIIITLIFFTFCGLLAARVAVYFILIKMRQALAPAGSLVTNDTQQKLETILGEWLTAESLTISAIEAKITGSNSLAKLKPTIEASIDHFLREKLKVVFPLLSTMMGEKTIGQLKDAFLAELELLFPIVMSSYFQTITDGQTTTALVMSKLKDGAGIRMMRVAEAAFKKELYFFPIAGAVTGALVGIGYLFVVYFTKMLPLVI